MLNWRKFSIFLFLLFFVSLSSFAASINVSRAEAELYPDGKLLVDTRFNVSLPPPLIQALEQGVSLSFRLEFDLESPKTTAFKLRIKNWFEPAANVNFVLSYHLLTKRYRVGIGSFSNYYDSLDSALKAIGGISGWQVLPPGVLKGVMVTDVSAKVRLYLDLSNLPKPFQMNAFGSSDWSLSTSWIPLFCRVHS